MKKKIIVSLILIAFFTIQVSSSVTQASNWSTFGLREGLVFSENAINIEQYLIDDVNSRKELWVYDSEETFGGYTLFNCNWGGRNGNLTTLIVDMNGNIVAAEQNWGNGPELINATTVFLWNDTHAMFWNLETNNQELIEVPAFEIYNEHHDVEYNPYTEQFLILGREYEGTVDVGGEIWEVAHDSIILVDKNNNTQWYWSGAENIPFDQDYFYLTNHTNTRMDAADWTHGNTVFWDMEEEDICYYNARHTHNIYKIDMTTGDIVWALGEYESDFTLYNINGEEVTSFFYGAHSIERIGENKFIIYDNDQYNTTDMSSNWPRYVEFEIDEENWEARETFVWTIPDNSTYIGDHWGDVDHLPGDTRMGTFGAGGSTDWDILTEVNEAGEIVWELAINGTDTYRAERFYDAPLIRVDEATLVSPKKIDAVINVTVWNSFRERSSSTGRVVVLDGDTVLLDQNINFLPFWQDTELSITIPTNEYKKGIYNLTIAIENADGISRILFFDLNVEKASAVGILLTFASLLTVAVVLRKKKK
jgi:hypothetical protein